MKFYPVEVDGVPQLARTQAEVKALGLPLPEQIEIDVAQGPLMDHLNRLMREAHSVRAAPLELAAMDEVLEEAGFEIGELRGGSTAPLNGFNGRCRRCGATPEGQQIVIDGMDQDAIIARLEAGPEWMRQNVKEALK